MALQYFLYTTLYNNTLVDRSNTTFAPLPPNTGEIYIDYLIPTIQPLYYYRNSGGTGGTIVLNDEATINAYLEATAAPPQPDDNVLQLQFTGYTATTNIHLNEIDNNVSYLSGQTDTKLAITDFNTYSGVTDTLIGTKLNTSDFNVYSGVTDTLIGTKLNTSDFNTYSGVTDTRINNNDGEIADLYLNKLDLSGGTLTGPLYGTSLQLSGTLQGTSAQLSGDLTVNGTMHIVHTEEIYTESDFIYMRSGASTGLGVGEISGFAIMDVDGSGTTVVMGTDMTGTMRVGWSGDTLQALATREDNPIDNGIAFWKESTQEFITTGYTMNGLTADVADKIPRVTGATDNIAIFNADGSVRDSNVTIESLTGGTGYYFYIDKTLTETTTSIVDIVYLSGYSAPLSAGEWFVDFNAIGGNLSPNKYIGVSFWIDSVLQGVESYFKTNDANVVMPFVITKDLTLTAGIHLFEIRYRNVGGTAILEYGAIRTRQVSQ